MDEPSGKTPDPGLMAETVRLALESIRTSTGGPFAAMIADGDGVVATGVNSVVPNTDPTAHAEVEAIRAACAKLGTVDLSGHVLYASCYPCPMCLAAAHWAGIDRVFHALTSDAAERMGFKDTHLYEMLAGQDIVLTPEPVRLVVPEADVIISTWLAKPDRIQY